MRVNSLKGAVNLVKKLEAKVPEMTAKNGAEATELLKELMAVLKAEVLIIFEA